MRDENQLHAAVVELVALDDATIKYSTVQNWYPGDKDGKGGIYNFVTKRGLCRGGAPRSPGPRSRPARRSPGSTRRCVLKGDDSVGEFYSVAVTNNHQQADTGTKMIHIGKNTRSTIVSKGISAGHGQNTYRGLVKILRGAEGARNYSQCDSLLIGDQCGAHTFPYIEVQNPTAQVEHEASTSKIGEDQIFYCNQRGIDTEDAVSHDRQRLLQGGLPRAADGVRGRGPEAPRREPRGQRRLRSVPEGSPMPLEYPDRDPSSKSRTCTPPSTATRSSTASTSGRARRGPRHHGPQRLGQVHARPGARRPRRLRGHRRPACCFDGRDLLAMAPEERAREGLFLAFQYPVEIPGVSNTYFLRAALNAVRKRRGAARARRR